MSRTLTVEARALDENHILGLREQFGHAEYEGAKLTWCHGFGFGVTSISMEVDMPDGTHISELFNIQDLMMAWAKQVLNEQAEKGQG